MEEGEYLCDCSVRLVDDEASQPYWQSGQHAEESCLSLSLCCGGHYGSYQQDRVENRRYPSTKLSETMTSSSVEIVSSPPLGIRSKTAGSVNAPAVIHIAVWMSPAAAAASSFPVMMDKGEAEVTSISIMRVSFLRRRF